MPLNELLMDGVQLMLIGMGSVFVFLTVLVFAMKLMSRVAMKISPAVKPSSQETVLAVPESENQQEIVAVISAAIAKYRSRT